MPAQTIHFGNMPSKGLDGLAEFLQKQKMQDVLIKEKQAKAENPLGLGSGDIGQVLQLEAVRQKYGDNHPIFLEAKRSWENTQKNKENMQAFRDTQMELAGKRTATQQGKRQQEISDIEAGYYPGSRRQVPISESQKKRMLNTYRAEEEKGRSDATTRQKALSAANIDKTLDNINPEDLLQYSGLAGAGKQALDYTFGRGAYENYQKALTAAKTLKKQIRQFYGDSIDPRMMAELEQLVIPSTWSNTPDIALSKFNQLKSILQQETQTYKDALGAPVGDVVAQGNKGKVKRRKWDAKAGRLVDAT